ncbi:MAG: MFS transporter [Chloroflexi bacterium]|nr:MFS transporter [Chloroflexota bacterium]
MTDSTRSGSRIPRLWPFKKHYYGWGIVSTSVLVSFAQVPMYGPVLSVFVKPIADDTGWSRAEIALAFTIGSLFGSFASSVTGHYIDRYGARTAVVVSGMIVTGALIGLAVMQEPWQFWILFGTGRTAALAGINMGTSVAVANWFIRKRGRAVSFLGIGLRSGQAIFPLFIAPVVVLLSWRHAYAMLAVVAFVLIVIPGWIFLRRRPEDLGLLPDGDAPVERTEAETKAGIGPATPPVDVSSWTLRQAMRTTQFWLLTTSITVIVFSQTAINLHAVASFQDRGVADAFAGVFVFIFAGIAALSAYVWGSLMDRFHVRWVTLVATGFTASAMFVIIFADNMFLALLFAVLFGLGIGGWTVAQVVLWANYFGRGHLGAIRGFSQLAAGPVGAVGPLLAGFLYDVTGDYTMAFRLFFGTMIIVAIALILARPLGAPPLNPDPTASES